MRDPALALELKSVCLAEPPRTSDSFPTCCVCFVVWPPTARSPQQSGCGLGLLLAYLAFAIDLVTDFVPCWAMSTMPSS